MSAVTATVDTLRVRSRTRAVALLGGLCTLLVLLTWGTWGDVARDTGYDLVAGARVAHGELPYADFTYYYGPLAPALLGLASWLGGAGLAPMLALGLEMRACGARGLVLVAVLAGAPRVSAAPAAELDLGGRADRAALR